MDILTALRQLKYPKEFRIGPSIWPLDVLSGLEKLAQSAVAANTTPPDQSSDGAAVRREHLRLLVEVGTGLWRIRRKLVQPGTDTPLDGARVAFRHLEATWNALSQAGVEIRDHTDAPYDSGMSIIVVAFEPTPGNGSQRIIETIKPTIYYGGQRIQQGEVIVGTPVESGNMTKGDSAVSGSGEQDWSQ